MRLHDLHFFPYPPLYLLIFLLLLGLLLVLLQLGVIGLAYEHLGLSRRAAILVLFAALLGSGINIPVARFPAQRMVEPRIVDFFGMEYVVPTVVERGSTVVAVNVGGAVIPVLLVIYLIGQYGLSGRILTALGVVTVVTHLLARPVPGVGIALPPLLPSLAAAGAALLLDRRGAPRTAFIAGTLGTLIGADLLNLWGLQNLGAPVVSIGGAGTFDGVFLTGIIAVLLAGGPGWRRRARRGGAPPPAEPPPAPGAQA
jgi:uncharacterized membrane protein